MSVATVAPGVRSYRATRVDPHEHRDELVRLWSNNLSAAGDLHRKLDWLYLRSPAGPGEAMVLRDEATHAVGCAGLTPRELSWGDRVLRSALLGDLAIDRAHRTAMPALVLQRATKQHVETTYDLAYGFPNANAIALHRRIGFHEIGVMSRYVRVLRHGGYLARKHGRPEVMRAAGMLVDAAKLGVRVARAVRPAVRAQLRWLDDFDPRFDDLWERTRGQWNILGRRDAALLRWRFLRKPDERVGIAALTERSGKHLIAYAVIGGQPGDLAHVHDVFGSLDGISDLLTLLVPALTFRGYAALSMRFLGDPRMMDLVTRHGMELRDARRSVIATFAPQAADAALRKWENWYITDLDEDS